MTDLRPKTAVYPMRPPSLAKPPLPEVLLPADYGDVALRRAVRSGEAIQLAKGVYARPSPAGSEEWRQRLDAHLARASAVNRHFGDTVVLSHATAALLHGLWAPIQDHPYVSHGFHAHKAPGEAPRCIRVCRPLAPEDVVVINGLRVTLLERTVLDCIASLSAPWALAVADSAMRHLTSADRNHPDEAEERARPIRLLWQRGVETKGPRRGRRQAREIVQIASGLSESSGESRTRCVGVAAGLPKPRLQMKVALPSGLAFPDLSFSVRGGPPRWVHVEYDGESKYGVHAPHDGSENAAVTRRLMAEKHREDELRADPATKTVIRVVNKDLAWPSRQHLVTRIADECGISGPLSPIPELNPLPPRRTKHR